jgi:hypothetical protein
MIDSKKLNWFEAAAVNIFSDMETCIKNTGIIEDLGPKK